MAHSRLEKIGTIYTRITGIIKAGSMKLDDRPLWYEVYQAFPPKYTPRFDRPIPEVSIKSIFYPEDIIRAKFYKRVKNVPGVNLGDDTRQSLCQKCIMLCTQFQKDSNLNLDEAFNKAVSNIFGEMDAKSLAKKEKDKLVDNPDVTAGNTEVQLK